MVISVLVSSSNVTHGRQVQMFCCFVNLNKQQVEEYYRKGPEDQYESMGIQFFTLDTIVNMMVVCSVLLISRIQIRIQLFLKRVDSIPC